MPITIRKLRRNRKIKHKKLCHVHGSHHKAGEGSITNDEAMRQQIWYYILMRYFQNQMFDQYRTGPDQMKSGEKLVEQKKVKENNIYDMKIDKKILVNQEKLKVIEKTVEQNEINVKQKRSVVENKVDEKKSNENNIEPLKNIIDQVKPDEKNIDEKNTTKRGNIKQTEKKINRRKSAESRAGQEMGKNRSESRIKIKHSQREIEKCDQGNDIPDFMKNISVSTDTSSFSTAPSSELSEQIAATAIAFRTKQYSDISDKSISDNSSYIESSGSEEQCLLPKHQEFLAKFELLNKKKPIIKVNANERNYDVDIDDDDIDNDDNNDEDNDDDYETSSECLDRKTEPSWGTVVKMMDNFQMMKAMFASGKKLF